MDYTMSTTLDRPYDATVAAVREALADQGFGVLTEIDLRATLAAKLGVEVAPQVILGACRPQLAHRALEVEPAIATLLPCNVVVRQEAEHTTRVEILDPRAMMSFTQNPDLDGVADDARERLAAALESLTSQTQET